MLLPAQPAKKSLDFWAQGPPSSKHAIRGNGFRPMIRPLPLRPHMAAGCSRQLSLQGGEFVSVLALRWDGMPYERDCWLLPSQVKCIMNSNEFGDVRYKPNGYFEIELN